MLNAAVTDLMTDTTALAAAETDNGLVRAAVGGDMRAFEAIYRRHASRIHGVIQRLVGGQACVRMT